MTVDIVRAEHNAVAVLGATNDALARLGEWVTAAHHAHQLVAPLVGTAFIPDAYKPRVDPRATDKEKAEARDIAIANATAAVLQGISLGLDPLTALQQIYVVHGRPGMYARIKVALVKSHGHEVWTEDLTDTRAVVCGRRKGTDYIERVIVTMDQARKAGWTSNQAYTKTPQDMLYARAAGRVCDRVAPEVLMGIASVEEIQDEIRVEAQTGNGTRTVAPRRRERPALAAPDDAPLDAEEIPVPPDEAPPGPAEPDGVVEGITDAQSKKMHALFREHGITERGDRLAYASQRVGREVTSAKELSKAEAIRIIDALETAPEPHLEPEPDVRGRVVPDPEPEP